MDYKNTFIRHKKYLSDSSFMKAITTVKSCMEVYILSLQFNTKSAGQIHCIVSYKIHHAKLFTQANCFKGGFPEKEVDIPSIHHRLS